MVQDVASRAPADQQEHQEWVRAADYFEVFPLQFMFDEYYSSPIGTADEKQWRLYEAFQIPVPEDLMVVVSVYFYEHPTHDGRYTSSIDAAEGT
ncbi:MAG: hypothetical protein IJV64_05930, partial [Oscillospiraceae bacterium]|nr:hypothetical protein [Oscillospiraceae bacterium]